MGANASTCIWVLSCVNGQVELCVLKFVWAVRDADSGGGGVNIAEAWAHSQQHGAPRECHGEMRQWNADSSEQCKQAALGVYCHAALKLLHSPITAHTYL